jgi:hypothetical protein
MSETTLLAVGWDVGAWHCDRPNGSQDALVVKDGANGDVGTPWRGNISAVLKSAKTSLKFIDEIRRVCAVPVGLSPDKVVVAIDAPLGFPAAVVSLLTEKPLQEFVGGSAENPYLFRETERLLASQGKRPLSAIQDQIGSQSTKAIFARRKFTPQQRGIGVWSDGGLLTVIETYPGGVRHRLGIVEDTNDIVDAARCADIAWAFACNRQSLEEPLPNIPADEGWIWLPQRGAGGGKEP